MMSLREGTGCDKFVLLVLPGLDIPKHGEPAYPLESYGDGWSAADETSDKPSKCDRAPVQKISTQKQEKSWVSTEPRDAIPLIFIPGQMEVLKLHKQRTGFINTAALFRMSGEKNICLKFLFHSGLLKIVWHVLPKVFLFSFQMRNREICSSQIFWMTSKTW